jgi:hypothetical protein
MVIVGALSAKEEDLFFIFLLLFVGLSDCRGCDREGVGAKLCCVHFQT